MELSSKIMSDIVVHTKYAKYVKELNRRESWEEIVTRNKDMHINRFPELIYEIEQAYQYVYDKKILPSMRSMQFAGKAIERNPARMYNCSYMPINHLDAFSETMFLLLSGCGVGYSVQTHHVAKIPEIHKSKKTRRYLIADSLEGWADAVKVLMEAYFHNKPVPVFDYSDIRPKGSLLQTSGGKAPGPDPLKHCLDKIDNMLNTKENGERLTTLECHDICCHIADAVLSGGIRRAAMISLFDVDDDLMLTCKSGEWWNTNPQRARANNSAVILRHKISKAVFNKFWKIVKDSNSGEPGMFFTNDKEYGMNPCKPLHSLILTKNGYITIKQALLLDKLEVVLPNGKIATATKPFKTGKDRTIARIKLSNGMFLYGTSNHQHQLQSGEWKTVDELNVGDKLAFRAPIVNTLTDIEESEYNSGVSHGWLLTEFSKTSFDWIRLQTPSFKLGLVRACFTADGSVRKKNNVELYSINREFLELMQTILLEYGIRSTVSIHNYEKSYMAIDGKIRNNANCWKLNVFAGQFKEIGLLSDFKQKLLDLQEVKNLYRRVDYETIVDIDHEWSIEDVYDITVDDDSHSYIDTGVITHNCAEIALRPNQFCNLTSINVSDVDTQDELNARAKAAAFLGTLQASYTDFHYLRTEWKTTTEKEALLGVSMTGVASEGIMSLDLEHAANIVVDENKRVAKLIGVNTAARTTCVKPEGTTSLVVGSSSGIHAWHAPYYTRRVRINKKEPIWQYLYVNHEELLEDSVEKPDLESVLSVPIKAPDGAITRDESSLDLLNRVSHVYKHWILPGHNKGSNTHNVSATVSVRDNEWDEVGEWMWKHRDEFTALSVLPYDGHVYQQAPFEDITKEQYEKAVVHLKDIDLTQVIEITDETNHIDQAACAGGACTI